MPRKQMWIVVLLEESEFCLIYKVKARSKEQASEAVRVDRSLIYGDMEPPSQIVYCYKATVTDRHIIDADDYHDQIKKRAVRRALRYARPA
jgi:hypothetical protein